MPFRSGIPFTFFLTLKKPNNDVNASQAAIVTGAEKNLKQLQTDSVELQNKITKLQGELSTNSKAQETQLVESENLRKILEAIRSRKKI